MADPSSMLAMKALNDQLQSKFMGPAFSMAQSSPLVSPFYSIMNLVDGLTVDLSIVHMSNLNSLSTFLKWLQIDQTVAIDVTIGTPTVITLGVETRSLVFVLPNDPSAPAIAPLLEILQSHRIVKFSSDAALLVANIYNCCRICAANVMDLKSEIEHQQLIAPLVKAKLVTSLYKSNEKPLSHEKIIAESSSEYFDALIRYVTSDVSVFYNQDVVPENISSQKTFIVYLLGMLASDDLPLICLSDLTVHQMNALLLSPDTFRWPLTRSSLSLQKSMLDRSRISLEPHLTSLGVAKSLVQDFQYPLVLSTMLDKVNETASKLGQNSLEALNGILVSVTQPTNSVVTVVRPDVTSSRPEDPPSPIISSSFDIQVSPPVSAGYRQQEAIQVLSAKRFNQPYSGIGSSPNSANYAYPGSLFGGSESVHPNTAKYSVAQMSAISSLTSAGTSVAMAASMIASRLATYYQPGIPLSSSPHPSRPQQRMEPSQPGTPSDPAFGYYYPPVAQAPLIPASVWNNAPAWNTDQNKSILSSLLSNPSQEKTTSTVVLSNYASPSYPIQPSAQLAPFSLFSNINVTKQDPIQTKHASHRSESDQIYVDADWGKAMPVALSPVNRGIPEEKEHDDSPVLSPVTSPRGAHAQDEVSSFRSLNDYSSLHGAHPGVSSTMNVVSNRHNSILSELSVRVPGSNFEAGTPFMTPLNMSPAPIGVGLMSPMIDGLGSASRTPQHQQSILTSMLIDRKNKRDSSFDPVPEEEKKSVLSFASIAAKVKQPPSRPSSKPPSMQMDLSDIPSATSSVVTALTTLSNPSPASSSSRHRDVAKATDLDKVLFKTAMCKRFTDTGFCSYGDQCGFAHGEAELRKLSAPERANLALLTRRESNSSVSLSETSPQVGAVQAPGQHARKLSTSSIKDFSKPVTRVVTSNSVGSDSQISPAAPGIGLEKKKVLPGSATKKLK